MEAPSCEDSLQGGRLWEQRRETREESCYHSATSQLGFKNRTHCVSVGVLSVFADPPPLLRAHTHTLGELDCGQTWDSSAWDRTQRAGVIHRERGIPESHRRQSTARSW